MITKQLRTRAALTSRARQLTAAEGLAGFTVQQLCDEVGISRRTFFNYFPSKESAVLGIENGIDDVLLDRFALARRAAGDEGRDLVDDLVELAIGHFEAMSPTAADFDDVVAALQREPKLITAAIESSRAEQRRFVDIVVANDSAQDHASAEVALVTFEALVRVSVEATLAAAEPVPFAATLRHRVALARALFGPAAHTEPAPPTEPAARTSPAPRTDPAPRTSPAPRTDPARTTTLEPTE